MSASPIYGTVAAWNWFRGQMLASSVAAVRADGRRMGAAKRQRETPGDAERGAGERRVYFGRERPLCHRGGRE